MEVPMIDLLPTDRLVSVFMVESGKRVSVYDNRDERDRHSDYRPTPASMNRLHDVLTSQPITKTSVWVSFAVDGIMSATYYIRGRIE
jgi:hypothetical protein